MKQGFIAIAFLLLGLIGGSTTNRYLAREHQHATAVMGLSQFHFDRFAAAVRQQECATGAHEAQAMQFFANEVALAFPLADAQDAVFHGYLEQLQQALTPVAVAPDHCAFNADMLTQIRKACADCHRDYR
jgi:hypothetical protein